MFAKYDAHWDGIGILNDFPCASLPCWAFNTSGWAGWDYSYRPAGVAVRHLGQGSYSVTSNGVISCVVYQTTLTRIAIGLADGTEVMLVDAATGGMPQNASTSSCVKPGLRSRQLFS